MTSGPTSHGGVRFVNTSTPIQKSCSTTAVARREAGMLNYPLGGSGRLFGPSNARERVQRQASSTTEWGATEIVRAERLCVCVRHRLPKLRKRNFAVLQLLAIHITFILTCAGLYNHCEFVSYINKKGISCFIRIFETFS